MAAGVSRTPVTDHGTDVWPGDSPRERDPVRGTHVRRDMSHPIVLRTRGFAVTVAVLAGVTAKVYVMLCYILWVGARGGESVSSVIVTFFSLHDLRYRFLGDAESG